MHNILFVLKAFLSVLVIAKKTLDGRTDGFAIARDLKWPQFEAKRGPSPRGH